MEETRAIIGASQAMERVFDQVRAFSSCNAPVLITGESGTGKELVARALHEHSGRNTMPFVALNCAAVPEALLESELFGHERGAFTGAVNRRAGRFLAAHGGTLFLDEVAELPLASQAKLLRILEHGIVEPLGTNASERVDVRIISATHRCLRERVAQGLFRHDLYYRLKVLEVALPPLRDHMEDVPLLVESFTRRFAGGEPPAVSPEAWAAINAYSFPGNVRELEHAMQHAVVLARGRTIEPEHLPRELTEAPGAAPDGDDVLAPLQQAARSFERSHLLRALRATDGRKSRAAELLGISRKNLWEKMRSHGIDDAELRDAVVRGGASR